RADVQPELRVGPVLVAPEYPGARGRRLPIPLHGGCRALVGLDGGPHRDLWLGAESLLVRARRLPDADESRGPQARPDAAHRHRGADAAGALLRGARPRLRRLPVQPAVAEPLLGPD